MGNKEVWIVLSFADAEEKICRTEGIFTTEKKAIENCEKDEFISLVDLNKRYPKKAIDSKKVYWPHSETWEESALYKMRQNQTD